MTRICLIDESFSGQLDTSVEDSDFIGPCAALPNAPTNLKLEMFGKLLFVMIQISVCTERCKVVAMNDNTDVSSCVVKAAQRGGTSCKANSLKSTAITQFPDVTSVTTPICALYQSANEIGSQAQLFGKVHELVADGLTVEIGFSIVNKTDSQGFALSGSLG